MPGVGIPVPPIVNAFNGSSGVSARAIAADSITERHRFGGAQRDDQTAANVTLKSHVIAFNW
jgi:hypothetical protein